MKLLIFLLMAVSALGNCVAVEGDRIRARDVAGVIPEFAKIAGDTVIGFAPLPTVRRVMSGGELVRAGRKFGLEIVAPIDTCFESPTEVLTREKILAQIKASMTVEGVEIELIEFSRYPVPRGSLSFPRSGLNAHALLTPQSIVFWRGKVVYGEAKSFQVWARVRMSVAREQLVAAETIRSGTMVTEGQVRIETVKQFPFEGQSVTPAEGVVGHIARRTIAKGQIVTAQLTAPPREVMRGAEVSVVVNAAGTQLRLPARAETSGAVGETVSVKNPVNGHSFRGVVNGKNLVTVNAK